MAGALQLQSGEWLPADVVIALPELVGPRIAGLPHDADGYIPVNEHGIVEGCADVFAAGDVISFPVKHGGLAAQQADAVAETIAARVGAIGMPEPFRPVLRALLMTGGAPLYLSVSWRRAHSASRDRDGVVGPALVAARQDRGAIPGAVPGHRPRRGRLAGVRYRRRLRHACPR